MDKKETIITTATNTAAEIAATAATTAAKLASTATDVAAAMAANNATLVADIKYIQRDIAEIKVSIKEISTHFVTREEFDPIKRIVYGMIGVLGLATMGAIFKLIFLP